MSTPVTRTSQPGLPATHTEHGMKAPPAPRGGSAAGWFLLVVPALVFVAEPFFVGHEAIGRQSSYRDLPFGVLIGLSGLWIVISAGRHTIPAVLAGICGVGLLFGAILAPHANVGVTVMEVFCGVFAVVVAALVGVRSPR